MSQTFVRATASFFLILGLAAVGFVMIQLSPYQSSGALDLLAVALLFLGLLVGLTGVCTLLALSIHRRWPAIAGAVPGKSTKETKLFPSAALRQGFLASLSLCAIMLFSMPKILDSIFIFVVFLLAGLIEAYFQSLER